MEAEANPAPNWLSELEAKREKRVKARLGHEAGAGAPCLTCGEKCPGLDLHFWRKICKNCKCSKEDHNVPDDDIYGWAEFQLLGSKPNRTKRKIVLPGNDEVELDWTPKGQPETIEKFLQTLPPESLPVSGSEAAQARKQLLQKQIPIHDLDPALCHDLSESETKTMNDYIDHMKAESVGVGRVIQVGPSPLVHVTEKHGSLGQMVENLNLNQAKLSGLPKKMAQYGRGEHPPPPYDSEQFPAHLGGLKTLSYGSETLPAGLRRPLHQYVPGQYNVYDSEQYPSEIPAGTVLDQGNFDDSTTRNLRGDLYQSLPGQQHGKLSQYTPGMHVSEQHPENIRNEACQKGPGKKELPCYAPGKYQIYNSEQYPERVPKDTALNYPQYGEGPQYQGSQYGEGLQSRYGEKLPYQESQLPQYGKGPQYGTGEAYGASDRLHQHPDVNRNPQHPQYQGRIEEDCQNALRAPMNIKDLAFSTYESEGREAGRATEDVSGDVMNSNNLKNQAGQTIRAGLKALNPHRPALPYDDEALPRDVRIGAIQDLNYGPDQRIKNARLHQNPNVHHHEEDTIVATSDTPQQCHKCSEPFAPNEFAIFVDRASTLYHHRCFNCHGCNQPLADMLYFYDKPSDAVYCGRDYAKIRGIPRCSACDELIFVKEYCLAENLTYHLKHFCCFECDTPLAGKDYLIEEGQPLCLPCYENSRAERCNGCGKTIGPTEIGCNLKGLHFHHSPECLACKKCSKALMGGKMLIKNDRLYCSVVCFQDDQ